MDILKRICQNKKAFTGLLLILLVSITGVFASWLAPYDPIQIDPLNGFKSSSSAHLLGTDFYGRDVLSRMIWGVRPSLIIGLSSVLLSCLIGTLIGFVTGYFRGWIDHVLMRVMDILLSFPIIVLALAIVATIGGNLINLVITISILFIPRFSRIIRGEVISLKEQDYVEAARAVGASDFTIICKHIFPNTVHQIIVTATVFVSSAILIESGLSFLGVGVVPPNPSLGNMLSEGRSNIIGAPWLTVFPGLMLMITLTGLNLLGDSIRDILDPKLRHMGKR
jgi:peptide/nickel transport system permease protein